jgi:hypothetical protein
MSAEPVENENRRSEHLEKSQIISENLEGENNITPQIIKAETTVVGEKTQSRSSYPTVRPVFDCLFCADSFIASQKLSIGHLTEKYAYNYILLKINEMGFKSRVKLSRPLSGFVKSANQSHKFIKESSLSSCHQRPIIMRTVMQSKLKKKQHKIILPQKDDLIELSHQNDLTSEEKQKVKHIEARLHVEEDEFSEIYDDIALVG